VKLVKKNPRTGLRLTRTQCNRCQKSFPGKVLHADQAYCPDCQTVMDKENTRAKFAPAKHAPLASEPEVAEDSPAVTHQS